MVITNVVASEVMVADTCIPSLIVIDITTEQLVTNVSIIIVYCLRLFVVYKHVMLQGRRQWWVIRVPSFTVISTALETNIYITINNLLPGAIYLL